MSVDRAITPHFSDDTEIFVPADEAPYRPAVVQARPARTQERPVRDDVRAEPVRERVLTGPALVAAASRLGPSVSAQAAPARTTREHSPAAPARAPHMEVVADEQPAIVEAPPVTTWTPVLRQVPAGEYDAHLAEFSGMPVRAPLAVVAPVAPEAAPDEPAAEQEEEFASAWTTAAADEEPAAESWSAQGWSQSGWAGQSWSAPQPASAPAWQNVSGVQSASALQGLPAPQAVHAPQGVPASQGVPAARASQSTSAPQGSSPAPRSAPTAPVLRSAPATQHHPVSAPPAWLSDAPATAYGTTPARPAAPVRRAAPLVASAPVVGSLAPDTMLRSSASAGSGWRRTIAELTGGRWNPGPSAVEAEQSERLRAIRTPVRSCRRIAVMSVKGGVGKTTVASMLGLTFADLRSDRVLAVDANPDLGTLADRLTGDVEIGIQHLLDFLSDATTFSVTDIEGFVSTNGRLQVLAGSREPCTGAAFTPEEYEEAIAALSSCYSVMIVDTGTGLSHSALAGVLATADDVVIVAEPTVDAASRASMTLDWLTSCGLGALAQDAIVVMSHDRGSREIDERAIREHFASRCGAVIEVPADPHLAAGGRIDRARCKPATRAAFEELAAVVGEGFSYPAPGGR